ncbi:MAG: amidohydrolase family protein, partial [Candidatus Kapabacteria bacterium]|nr:amidohydrolase family protein [Candidatus Kapabacteria bacterium]
MTSFQGIIHASRARIVHIEELPGGVTIINDTHTYTFPGAYLLPGLVDSHAHILGLGMKMTGLALYDCESAEEVRERCVRYTMRRGDWLYAMGWNHELWSVPVVPDRHFLDEVFPDTPVYLRRADGHSAWVNSVALRNAGITDSTPNPDGGAILRDENGQATGILLDNAMLLIENIIPPLTPEQSEHCITTALQSCAAQG